MEIYQMVKRLLLQNKGFQEVHLKNFDLVTGGRMEIPLLAKVLFVIGGLAIAGGQYL